MSSFASFRIEDLRAESSVCPELEAPFVTVDRMVETQWPLSLCKLYDRSPHTPSRTADS